MVVPTGSAPVFHAHQARFLLLEEGTILLRGALVECAAPSLSR
jgi:hypothetical protein